MVDQERDSTGDARVMCSDGEAVNKNIKVNGFVAQLENACTANGNHAGSSRVIFRTYKRRKHAHAVEDVRSSGDLAGQMEEKLTKGLLDMDGNGCSSAHSSIAGMGFHVGTTVPDDSSLERSRNIVLEHICKSLYGEGGLKRCIQDALAISPENGCTCAIKKSVHPCEDGRRCTSHSVPHDPRIKDSVNGIEGVVSNASVNETNHQRVTERCQQIFSDVITSEKFSLLCRVLIENFQGVKADKLFNISIINSRIREGAYEHSPVLFFSDIQQIWTKVQKVGAEILELAKNLSEKSKTSYYGQFVPQESDMSTKVEQREACSTFKVCVCKRCGGKADGRDCLVCDSCEEMFHVSCIEPAIKEIPVRSWYCASCTAKGIESPHDNCLVCERLNASRSLISGGDDLSNAETWMDLEESSNGLTDDTNVSNGVNTMFHCNICRTDIKNGEKIKICGHTFCPHKFYHARCLTSKQLDSYGRLWYCPSCLCRVCLTDRDDEKIVLCDSCDHAYHIYCMQPPLTMVPRGKWFCRKCDAEIQCIHKAKRRYLKLQSRLRKSSREGKTAHGVLRFGKGKKVEGLDRSGGVDMLLSAARTLNYEENLAARQVKSSLDSISRGL